MCTMSIKLQNISLRLWIMYGDTVRSNFLFTGTVVTAWTSAFANTFRQRNNPGTQNFKYQINRAGTA